MDGGGIDIWKGTDKEQKIDAIMCTVDVTEKIQKLKYYRCVNIEGFDYIRCI